MYIITKVPSTETGIAMPVISVARVAQEQVQHEDREQAADQRRLVHLADRRVDEVRLVVDRLDLAVPSGSDLPISSIRSRMP